MKMRSIISMNFKVLMVVFYCLLNGFISLMAAPAAPGFYEIKQPDGTYFLGHQKGDEWFNWTETLDKSVVIRNKNTGYYEYAIIKVENNKEFLAPSGEKVKEDKVGVSPAQRNLKPISRKDLLRLRSKAIETRKSFK